MKFPRLILVFVFLFGLFSSTEAFSQLINVPADDAAALIDAINQANLNPDAATINLGGGIYTLTLVNNSVFGTDNNGLPLILTDMTFNGNGSIIERSDAPATPEFRIFYIGDAENDIFHPDVIFNNLTIRHGVATSSNGAGGIFSRSDGIVTINDSVISDNTATSDQTAGVNNDQQGTMNVNRTTITRNINSGTGGSGSGGIINDFDGVLNITDSTISFNVGTRGGGVANNSSGIINIINTTISNNMNSRDTTATGAGVYLNSGGDVFIDSSTITENDGTNTGNVGVNGSGSAFLINTIVGNGIGAQSCITNPNNANSEIISQGYNIDQDGSCGLNSIGDKSNTNPRLAPLGNYGGTTETHALFPNSPALNMGNPDCPPPATDQRGEPRPQGLVCDIGAFEGQIPFSVPTLSDWGLIFLVGILGIIGFIAVRRRTATA